MLGRHRSAGDIRCPSGWSCSANRTGTSPSAPASGFLLGHQLARMEGKSALKSLFQRWPKLTLAAEKSEIAFSISGPASARLNSSRVRIGRALKQDECWFDRFVGHLSLSAPLGRGGAERAEDQIRSKLIPLWENEIGFGASSRTQCSKESRAVALMRSFRDFGPKLCDTISGCPGSRLLLDRNTWRTFNPRVRKCLRAPLFSHTPP